MVGIFLDCLKVMVFGVDAVNSLLTALRARTLVELYLCSNYSSRLNLGSPLRFWCHNLNAGSKAVESMQQTLTNNNKNNNNNHVTIMLATRVFKPMTTAQIC